MVNFQEMPYLNGVNYTELTIHHQNDDKYTDTATDCHLYYCHQTLMAVATIGVVYRSIMLVDILSIDIYTM